MTHWMTAAKALQYARDQQIDLRAALARKDIRASDDAKAARNKRNWALRQWHHATGKPDPADGTEEQIEAFLFPQKEKA